MKEEFYCNPLSDQEHWQIMTKEGSFIVFLIYFNSFSKIAKSLAVNKQKLTTSI